MSRLLAIVTLTVLLVYPGGVSGQKCGFPYYVTQNTALREVTLQLRSARSGAEAYGIFQTYISPSGHFRVHYQTEGYNAIPNYDRNQNGTPDYLEFVAYSFDRAWAIEIDSLGFQPPPDANGNPRTTYDIYCVNLAGSELYGYTAFDPQQDIAALPGLNFTSDIYLSTQFSFVVYEGVTDPAIRDSLAIAVTAAHEFNHALQLGYRIWGKVRSDGLLDTPDLWFIEATATYMEEVVADQVNDYYQYLPDFFTTTHLSLTHTPDPARYIRRLYGEVVWFIQMGELWGKTITRRLWERVKTVVPAQALREEFQQRHRTMGEMLAQLATWMYYCGTRAAWQSYFPEAEHYPTTPVQIWNAFTSPSNVTNTMTIALQTNAFSYIHIASPSPQEAWFTIHPEPLPFRTGGVLFKDNPHLFTAGSLNKVVLAPGETTAFAVIRAGEMTNQLTQADVTAELRPFPGEDGMKVFPVQINFPRGMNTLSVAPIEGEGTIQLFSAQGRKVLDIPFTGAKGVLSLSLLPWQHQLASGVYVVRVIPASPLTSPVLRKILIIK